MSKEFFWLWLQDSKWRDIWIKKFVTKVWLKQLTSTIVGKNTFTVLRATHACSPIMHHKIWTCPESELIISHYFLTSHTTDEQVVDELNHEWLLNKTSIYNSQSLTKSYYDIEHYWPWQTWDFFFDIFLLMRNDERCTRSLLWRRSDKQYLFSSKWSLTLQEGLLHVKNFNTFHDALSVKFCQSDELFHLFFSKRFAISLLASFFASLVFQFWA